MSNQSINDFVHLLTSWRKSKRPTRSHPASHPASLSHMYIYIYTYIQKYERKRDTLVVNAPQPNGPGDLMRLYYLTNLSCYWPNVNFSHLCRLDVKSRYLEQKNGFKTRVTVINEIARTSDIPDGTNNCWFPLARKWPTWKWTWIWIPYGKIEKKMSALLQTGFTGKSTRSEHVSHRPFRRSFTRP